MNSLQEYRNRKRFGKYNTTRYTGPITQWSLLLITGTLYAATIYA